MRECLEVMGKTVEEAVGQALDAWSVTRDEVEIIVVEEPSKGFLGFGARDAKVKVFRKDAALVDEQGAVSPVEQVAPGVVVFNEVEHADPIVADEVLPTDEGKTELIRLHETDPLTLDSYSAERETTDDATPKDAEAVAAAPRSRERETFFSAEEQEEAARRGKDFLQQVTQSMGVSVMIEKMTSPDMICLHLHGDDLGLLIGKRGTTLDALQYLTNLAANRDVRGRYFIMLDVENYRARREETLIALARRMAGKVKKSGRKVVLEPMNAYERKIIHTALQDDPQVYTLSEGEYQDRHLVIHYRD